MPDQPNQSGGVNISGVVGTVGGDIVGGDKTTTTATNTTELAAAFHPIAAAIATAPPEHQAEATAKLDALQQEAAKGKHANDSTLAKLVDGLVALVPAAATAVVSAFGTPILGALAGPVTTFVLNKLRP